MLYFQLSLRTHHAAIHFFSSFSLHSCLGHGAFHLLPNWKPSIPCKNKYNPQVCVSTESHGVFHIDLLQREANWGGKKKTDSHFKIYTIKRIKLSKKEFCHNENQLLFIRQAFNLSNKYSRTLSGTRLITHLITSILFDFE